MGKTLNLDVISYMEEMKNRERSASSVFLSMTILKPLKLSLPTETGTSVRSSTIMRILTSRPETRVMTLLKSLEFPW